MRPPKRILLLCADEELMSRLVVVLESRLYQVLAARRRGPKKTVQSVGVMGENNRRMA